MDGYNVQYRNADDVVTGAGFQPASTFEKADHSVATGVQGDIPDLFGKDGDTLTYLKKYDSDTNSLVDNT
jgi:hypothetical protein